MKKVLGIVLVFTLMLAGCSSEEAASENAISSDGTMSFNLAHAAAETHPFHTGVLKFVDLVEEKSEGRIKITVFPGRQLGDEKEGLENVMKGTTEMALVSTPILSAYTPIFDALQLPFLLNNYEIEEKAYETETMNKMLGTLNESMGIQGLGALEGGMRHIANNVKEINTPEDLKGLKLRTVESPLILDIFKELGASPTPMAYGEVYTSLETGVLDGEEVNLTTIVAEKHSEVLEHLTLAGQFPFPALLLINDEIFQQLSEEDQKILQDSAQEASTFLFEEITKVDTEALETIKELDINVVELQDVDSFKNQMTGIYEEYMAKDPLIEEFVNKVEAMK